VGGRGRLLIPTVLKTPQRREAFVQKLKVNEIMVPIEDYATVCETATMFDAVVALEKAQAEFDQSRYRHRAVLVCDEQNNILGKVSQMDLLKALEPKIHKLMDAGALARTGYALDYYESITRHGLWSKPLDDLCRKAAALQVKDFMYAPVEGEFIKEDADLDEAVHRLVVGQHHSLLVTRGRDERIVGVLRLTDVFKLVTERVKACR
jgi:CBS domain-containing protein